MTQYDGDWSRCCRLQAAVLVVCATLTGLLYEHISDPVRIRIRFYHAPRAGGHDSSEVNKQGRGRAGDTQASTDMTPDPTPPRARPQTELHQNVRGEVSNCPYMPRDRVPLSANYGRIARCPRAVP